MTPLLQLLQTITSFSHDIVCDWFPSLFVQVAYLLLKTSLIVSVCHYFGWIQRLLWIWMEHSISHHALNGTPVTIGNLKYDLFRGVVVASNVILHQPHREEWQWSSPVLARVGHVVVEFPNVFGIILGSILMLREWPGQTQASGLDLYSIQVSDVQIFVERRSHVFNFYLCDASLELPNPKDVLPILQPENDNENNNDTADMDDNSVDSDTNSSSADHEEEEDSVMMDEHDEDTTTHQAQEIVHDMVSAVHSLSRAAQRGSWKGALDQHRRKFTDKLKELKDHKQKIHALKEGSRVMMRVGQTVVAQTTATAALPPLPKRKATLEQENVPLYVRVGRIQLREMRIFTQDHWEPEKKKKTKNETQQQIWNKPIVIEEVTIRSSELCPPMSMLDPGSTVLEGTNNNHSAAAPPTPPLPSIYQPMDRLLDVVLKRILAETAKTNTGRLFKTAMGEVFSLMTSNGTTTATTTTTMKTNKRNSVSDPVDLVLEKE